MAIKGRKFEHKDLYNGWQGMRKIRLEGLVKDVYVMLSHKVSLYNTRFLSEVSLAS